MAKYRYARANGEFLPSRFVEQVQSPVDAFFTTQQAYDLRKDFVSGSDVNTSSFVSDKLLLGYQSAKKLVAWWKPGHITATTAVTAPLLQPSVIDSSGNGHAASQATKSLQPKVDRYDTPGVFIDRNSLLFTAASSTYMTVDDSDAFSFGNGTADRPFSIAVWAKFSTTGNNEYIITKWNYAGLQREYLLWKPSTDRITLEFYDESSDGIGKAWTSDPVISAATWHHIVATYDGRGGASSGAGINIYIDGSAVSTGTTSDAAYTSMENTTANLAIANRDDPLAGSYFSGNLADVAIWKMKLSAGDVKNLYGVSIAGAYRLVRRFDQISRENDTRLLETRQKATGRGVDVTALPSDTIEAYRQGTSVKTLQQLLDYTSFKIRPNSGFITTLRGKDVPRTAFDAALETTSVSGSAVNFSIGGVGRVSARLSHEREQRDLGQTNVYDTVEKYEPFEDLGVRSAFSYPSPFASDSQMAGNFVGTVSGFSRLDPVEIIKTRPNDLILPRQLVVQTSDELNDGAIEPLIIRSAIDRSSIEQPFYAHDFRTDLSMIDAYRRSMQFADGWDLDEAGGASFFLDTVESIYGVAVPGQFATGFAVITPFVDYANDRAKEYTTNGVSPTIAYMLISSGTFEDDDIRTYDKMAAAGFVFDNDPIGIDSIAYGGLKK